MDFRLRHVIHVHGYRQQLLYSYTEIQVFVLAKIVIILIRENKEYSISQNSDHTPIILDGTPKSLDAPLRLL